MMNFVPTSLFAIPTAEFCMQPTGGHDPLVNDIIPLSFYHRVFRSPIKLLPDVQGKKSIDTEAQKLLRPVLESAAQGLSRAQMISTSGMSQVHSDVKIFTTISLHPVTLRYVCLLEPRDSKLCKLRLDQALKAIIPLDV
eukprot:SAG11_NODE_1372_length_5095_cov_15.640312_4_plen_139_part_00